MKKIKMTCIKDRQWKFDILLMGHYQEANQKQGITTNTKNCKKAFLN